MSLVLVVDDDATDRHLLVTLLRYSGHRSVEASDGKEALEIAVRERPDLVITDVLMPRMDGYEFVRSLRADRTITQPAVIFYTAMYYEESARALAASCGVTDLLVKPTDPEALLAAIAAAIGGPKPMPLTPSEDTEQRHLHLLEDKLAATARSLEATNARLAALLEVSRHLHAESNPHALVDRFCTAARDLIAARCATVTILDENGLTVLYSAWTNVDHASDRPAAVQPDPAGIARLLGGRGAIRVHGESAEVPGLILGPGQPTMRSFMATRIASPTRLYGYACFGDKLGGDSFTSEDEGIVSTITGQLAVAYENARRFELVERYAQDLERRVREVRQQRSALQTLLDSMTEGVLAVGEDGLVRETNSFAIRLLHSTTQAIAGQPASAVLAVEAEGPPFALMTSLGRCCRLREAESRDDLWLTLRDGRRVPVSLTITPEQDGPGAVILFRDVSQWREVEELRQSFVSLVSHELRTPLHHIKGFASTLLQTDVEWDEETRRDFIGTIDREADRLTRLVEELLEMSRLESGRIKVEPNQIKARSLVEAGVREAQPFLTGYTLALEVAEERYVIADAPRVERVLVNLLENAAKYSPQGSRIEVQTQPQGEEVRFSVADHGCGIAPENLERVFEKFTRLPQTTRQVPGTGLGLAICKAIVEQHGGRIWVESVLGKGSTFYFTLRAGRS